MSKIGLIIAREYTTRVKKRAFIVLTILVPLLVVGLMFLAIWLSLEEKKHINVLVADPRNLCGEQIFVGADEKNPPATFYFYAGDLEKAEFLQRQDMDKYDVLIGLGPNVITNKKIGGYYREEPSADAKDYIQDKLELRLEEYFAMDKGISLEEYRSIRQRMDFELESFDNSEEKEIRDKAQMIGLVFSVFIFIFITVYAAQVMRGVIEEKTSRVVEIIVSSVKPFELMMGKIIAVGLVGLTQFLIWVTLIVVLVIGLQTFVFKDILTPENWQGINDQAVAINQISTGMETADMQSMWAKVLFHYVNWPLLTIMFLIYFIGGYLLYGSLFAMIGSAVDSETDTQQLMLPVMLPLMFTYVVSVMIQGNSDGATAVWLSHIPFSSPIIMLQRIAAGSVAPWELILSLVILTITFITTTYLAAKIYRVGILMYGKKSTWKELFKWMRQA
ncbi:MAG: ABC transporter permease [Bacteroidetes bacterium]|nr:ABC transporter permease [Bacteroidota bacterium]